MYTQVVHYLFRIYTHFYTFSPIFRGSCATCCLFPHYSMTKIKDLELIPCVKPAFVCFSLELSIPGPKMYKNCATVNI